MKQHMRIGVMASLMAAPVVAVSANENIEVEELHTFDVGEQHAVVASAPVAVDPLDWRLNELLKLNESTDILASQRYTDILTDLALSTTKKEEIALQNILSGKITYLSELAKLKKDATALNNKISLLKTSNPDVIAVTEKLVGEYTTLQSDFEASRSKFDTVVITNKDELSPTKLTGTALPSTVLADAVDHLSIYKGSLEDYILTQVPKHDTLKKMQEAIVEPKKFIESDTTPITIDLAGKNVTVKLKEFTEKTTFTDADDISNYREQYEAINLYMSTKLTADAKKIVESHQLPSGQAFGTVLKQITTDIGSADKVTALIDAMDTTEFKSESTFTSKVKAITTAYEKLTDRGKALVPEYGEKVKLHTAADGTTSGYLAAQDVIDKIKALKPAATPEYRAAVIEVRTAMTNVHLDFKKYVISEPKLAQYEADIVAAQTVEAAIAKLDNPTPATTAADIIQARDDYKALSNNARKVFLKTSLDTLVAWEKTAKDSITVNTAIQKLKIENRNTFSTNVAKIQKQFDTLGTDERKALVNSAERLKLLAPLAKLTGEYYALKLGATPEYRAAVKKLNIDLEDAKETSLTDFGNEYEGKTADVAELKVLFKNLQSLIAPKFQEVTAAEAVEQLINEAKAEQAGPEQLKKIQKARADYNDLSASAKKIVNNLKTLTDLEKNVSQPSKVAQQIQDVDPTATTFESKAKAAITAFDKLTSSQKAYINDDVKKQVADYTLLLDFLTQIKAIKVTNSSYRSDVEAAKKRAGELNNLFTSTKKDLLKEAVEKAEKQLKLSEEAITRSDKVVALIEALPSKTGEAFFKGIAEIEAEYDKLSANDKKLVTNYKFFQNYKKDSATAAKVIDLINNTYILNLDVANVNYEKAMKAAITAYDKLTTSQRAHVYNYNSRIQPNLNVYELAIVVNKINPNSKTYLDDVATARSMYNRLQKSEQTVAAPLLAKIESAEQGNAEIQKVIDLINEAMPGTENYTDKLKEARAAYDRLMPAFQKLVTNYKQLQDREKALSPVTSSIYEIDELKLLLTRPFNDAASFVKKYQAAMKAYEKIPFESRPLITNRDVLLKEIYPVASTMEAILNIKESSKTFGADVLRAREMYDQLSASDKALVTNYNTLTGFEVVVAGGAKVDELIKRIPTLSGPAYMQAIKDARAAYEQLSTSEKRSVALYPQLQAYEKAVQNVLQAIDLIDALQFSSNLVTAYDKAMKALDKLTADQRKMVSNMQKLTAVAPAIEVYKMIANLKPGAEGYSGSVQAAYAAYNRLSNAEKQYVTNFAQLQEAKNNIDNLNAVIAKIKEIQPGSRNYAKQVQEALALYNSLPASVKKLVTNYDILKTAEKELNAVEKVRSLIAEIDNKTATFAQKVIAARQAYDKLTATQKRLVSNYFMLEEYERELGTMF